jgi:hypothetical protein
MYANNKGLQFGGVIVFYNSGHIFAYTARH